MLELRITMIAIAANTLYLGVFGLNSREQGMLFCGAQGATKTLGKWRSTIPLKVTGPLEFEVFKLQSWHIWYLRKSSSVWFFKKSDRKGVYCAAFPRSWEWKEAILIDFANMENLLRRSQEASLHIQWDQFNDSIVIYQLLRPI